MTRHGIIKNINYNYKENTFIEISVDEYLTRSKVDEMLKINRSKVHN